MTTASALLSTPLREGRLLARDIREASGDLRARSTDRSVKVEAERARNDSDRLAGYAQRLDEILDEIALTRIGLGVVASIPDDDDDPIPFVGTDQGNDELLGIPEQCGRTYAHGRHVCHRAYGHTGPCAAFGLGDF